ncbi:transporter [Nonomuraea turkmeniaca]|uniref:Transporter n=1 Tax=Nonomuraea turkmeniaca TaxID=103838 RepID=A0A5S4FR11_9ACTN|nr:transporter [Nonomuraea turkmeniaca]TMR11827.1 transporter [Nonomuraea turkmeniaca]
MLDDERAPSPEETLRVIEEQQAAAARHIYIDPLVLYLPWGVAWLLGFTAFFLHYGLDGRPYAPISQPQALSVLMIAQLLAGAVAAYGITRMNRQVRGDTRAKGAMYGYAWFAGITLVSIIATRLASLLPPQESGLLWAGAMLTIVAVLYMVGGAIWLTWQMFFVGVWVAAVNGVGVLLGAGWHALLTAVLLGGGFIVAGLWLRRRA